MLSRYQQSNLSSTTPPDLKKTVANFCRLLIVTAGCLSASAHCADNSTTSAPEPATSNTICDHLRSTNPVHRQSCIDFVKRHPGKYRKVYLTKEIIEGDDENKPLNFGAGDEGHIYVVPPGDYAINQVWAFNNTRRILILGEPDSTTGKLPSFSISTTTFFNEHKMFDVVNSSAVKISGLEIDPNVYLPRDQVANKAITVRQGDNIYIDNIVSYHFSDNGYFQASKTATVHLSNIHIEHKSKGIYTTDSIKKPAILLENCDTIHMSNIKAFNLDQDNNKKSSKIISLVNPVKFDIKDVQINLHTNTDKTQALNFIDILFSDKQRYSGKKVAGTIDRLMVGEYDKDSESKGASYSVWPASWHAVGFSKAGDFKNDAEKRKQVTGTLEIRNTQLHGSTIRNAGLFPNIRVSQIKPTVTSTAMTLLSTASSLTAMPLSPTQILTAMSHTLSETVEPTKTSTAPFPQSSLIMAGITERAYLQPYTTDTAREVTGSSNRQKRPTTVERSQSTAVRMAPSRTFTNYTGANNTLAHHSSSSGLSTGAVAGITTAAVVAAACILVVGGVAVYKARQTKGKTEMPLLLKSTGNI